MAVKWAFIHSFKDIFSLSFNYHFFRWNWISQYQNVSILDHIGAKGDGGGGNNWSFKTCNAPLKLSRTTNKPTPSFLMAGCPSCHPTNSVKAVKGNHLKIIKCKNEYQTLDTLYGNSGEGPYRENNTRRGKTSVKATKHGTIRYVRYSFLFSVLL